MLGLQTGKFSDRGALIPRLKLTEPRLPWKEVDCGRQPPRQDFWNSSVEAVFWEKSLSWPQSMCRPGGNTDPYAGWGRAAQMRGPALIQSLRKDQNIYQEWSDPGNSL
jgi:hypothetical protein